MDNELLVVGQQAFWKGGASKGGKKRAEALTSDERKAIAQKAAQKRWNIKQALSDNADIPEASWPGELEFGDLKLPCAVLDNGIRVLSERGMTKALGGKRGGSHWEQHRAASPDGYLPVFMSAGNLMPYVTPSLRIALANPILYRVGKGNAIGYGVVATLLPEICGVWLTARRAKVLVDSQEHIADKAEILIAALAKVGIIALIDEATGYEKVKDQNELQRILAAYISPELLPWTQRFPPEFYKELFRLRNWQYSPPQPKRPSYVGKLTNELVYSKLPRGVLEELRRKNPKTANGWRRHKFYQFLTEDIGDPHLQKHLVAVITLMRASPSWGMFYRLFSRAFQGGGIQQELPDMEDV